jgi:hypothetical protein
MDPYRESIASDAPPQPQSTCNCAGCGVVGCGHLVHFPAKADDGTPQQCASLRPPHGWGMRSMDNGKTTVVFCDECRGKLARGEMKI